MKLAAWLRRTTETIMAVDKEVRLTQPLAAVSGNSGDSVIHDLAKCDDFVQILR